MSKCLSGRPKIKERAFDILLTYIEIDKNAEIEEELVKGLENKQPKIVQACLELLRKGLSYVVTLHLYILFANFILQRIRLQSSSNQTFSQTSYSITRRQR